MARRYTLADLAGKIDELAESVKHGFDAVDKRFDQLQDHNRSILTDHERRIARIEDALVIKKVK